MVQPEVRKLTKNEKRRSKKKDVDSSVATDLNKTARILNASKVITKEIEVVEPAFFTLDYEKELIYDNVLLGMFSSVFEKFSKPEELLNDEALVVKTDGKESALFEIEEENSTALTISKRKKRANNRLTAAELKQLVQRPDAVEAHDVSSSDPRLLVYLKSYRNTVPVPRHWCAIRKYLQGKRGVEKVPFQLPEFIAETGIAKIRESVLEQDALKKGKQKTRERVKPKIGKIDIDYQVLHDAFFKYQTKPKNMSTHGDLYYEGKEFEVNMKEKRPGNLSIELQTALGIEGGKFPPPWLVNMQRYGIPPSYPNIKVPGLNAPLPPGASFGFQPGGWGKPPTDEYGNPLYGDVFGVHANDVVEFVENFDKAERWGTMEPEVEEVYVDDEEEEEGDEEDNDGRPVTAADVSGVETPNTLDGLSSIRSFEQGTVDLRKRVQGTPDTVVDDYDTPHQELYQVVQERSVTGGNAQGTMFGSDRAYVLSKPGGNDEHEVDSVALNAGTASTAAAAASKKRKIEPSASVKKMKEFKF